MDKRTVERQPAGFTAICHSMGKAAPARLHNISTLGCLLQTEDPILAGGHKVRIRIPGISTLDGRVAWHEGDRAGIEFVAALHPNVVAYIARQTSASTDESDLNLREALGRAIAGLTGRFGGRRMPERRTG